jgi:hypothetical protein
MKLFTRTRVVLMLVCLLAAILISGSVSVAQEKSDTALEKKYAPILGDYEFDLTDMGGDVQLLAFHITEGALWVDSGDGDPAVCEPVEGAEFEFTAVASDGQDFEIRFAKDDEGHYAICHINILSMGIEIEGTKIK